MGNIVIVGVLNKAGSTNLYMAKSFMKKGFNVIPVNYRDIIQTFGSQYLGNLMLHVVKKYSPKLILFSKCNGVDPSVVKECTNLTTTWLWNMDAKNTIEHSMEVVEHAKNSTFSSCTSPTTVEWFESLGVKNCYHIFEGVDTSIFKPSTHRVDRYKADISFIGTRTSERDKYGALLKENGYDVKFYGNGYSNKEVINEEFAQICSNSKFMLSLNVHNNIPYYFSDRIFRYLACKSCVVHLDNTGTLNKWFENNKDIVYFSNENDLLSKLKSITKDERVKIAESGYRKVVENYTWDKTIERILEIAK